MLNPESVDYNKGRVRLTFTDDNADEVLKVYMTEADAWRLHEMIQGQLNMKGKKEFRSVNAETYDPNF